MSEGKARGDGSLTLLRLTQEVLESTSSQPDLSKGKPNNALPKPENLRLGLDGKGKLNSALCFEDERGHELHADRDRNHFSHNMPRWKPSRCMAILLKSK